MAVIQSTWQVIKWEFVQSQLPKYSDNWL